MIRTRREIAPRDAPVIRIDWTGLVVSDNRKTIRIRGGVTMNSREYTAYKQSVAWTIRAQCPGVTLARTKLTVRFRLEGHRDAQNCLKGLLDGIQLSGLVKDDRHIAPIELLPSLKHRRGAMDEAELMFEEVKR